MESPEIDELRKENSRLRKIIDLLLEKISLLEGNYSQLENETGNSGAASSLSENKIGNIRADSSVLQTELGNIRNVSSLLENITRNNTTVSSHSSFETGKERSEISDEDQAKEQAMVERLKSIIPSTGPASGRKHLALVLIHFSKGGSGKNASLRHLTGMTESGVAKMIYQMKKKGLILRRGMHHYLLTDKAQDWIVQAAAS